MKEIQLTQGKVALVDDVDFEELNKHRWYAMKSVNTYYAVRRVGTSKHQVGLFMHRLLLNSKYPLITDHIDRNGLNNQRTNLRSVSHRQNCQNRNSRKSSKYVGVCWHKSNEKWHAQISCGGRSHSIGFFDIEEDAYEAYKNECKKVGCDVICSS